MKRLLLACLPALGVLLWMAPARANFEVSNIKIYRDDTSKLLTTQDLTEFFNKGHCQCEVPMRLLIELSGDITNTTFDMQVVVGRNCLVQDDKSIATNCINLLGPIRVDKLPGTLELKTYVDSSKNTRTLTAKTMLEGSCDTVDRKTYNVTVFVDSDDDGQWEEKSKIDYTVDTDVPAAPKSPTVAAGEGQVTVNFTAHTSDVGADDGGIGNGSATDKNFRGYQVLCQEQGSAAQPLTNPPEAKFESAINLCGNQCQSTTPVVDAGAGADGSSGSTQPVPRAGDAGGDANLDAGVDASTVDAGRDAGSADSSVDAGTTTGDTTLCAKYVCSELSKDTSIKVSGLQNNKKYSFWVITVDQARNPSTPVAAGNAEPKLVEDLWERYKRQGGKAEGGHCFVATAAYGSYDHPHVRVLRDFRDEVLLESRAGAVFVRNYYTVSPPVARWLDRHPTARAAARTTLWPVTVSAGAYVYSEAWHKLLALALLGLALSLLGLRRRQRRHGGEL